MSDSRILSPLLFVRRNKTGQSEVRLITCPASDEVRVYSRESVLDASKEIRLENCRIFKVRGQPAPRFAHTQIREWQGAGFRPLSHSGRTFDVRTRTLTEGVDAIFDDTLPVVPMIRAPWWFT